MGAPALGFRDVGQDCIARVFGKYGRISYAKQLGGIHAVGSYSYFIKASDTFTIHDSSSFDSSRDSYLQKFSSRSE